MKAYRCLDAECKAYLAENERLSFKNPFGKIVYKCSRCRGNLEEVEIEDENLLFSNKIQRR